jgi:hypothetical protein
MGGHLETGFHHMPIACPNCGAWANENSNFCERCGHDLRPLRSGQPVNIPNASFSPALDDMKKTMGFRNRTDRIISRLWILVPLYSLALAYLFVAILIIEIEAIFAAVSASPGTTPVTPPTFRLPPYFAYVELFSLVLSILFYYLFYILIKRRNLHFEREYRFFYDTSLILKNLVAARGLAQNQDAQNDLRYIDSDLTTIHYLEKERSAILWVILLIIPFVDIIAYFYIFYFLMRDFGEHEPMEDMLVAKISKVLGLMGASFSFSRENSHGKIPNRSFALYLILDLITLGAFGIYWIYTLIKDPNNHFRYEIQIEENLVSAINSLS